MKFGNQVVMFDFEGIPMVGNLGTGYVIGLTPDGRDLCRRLMNEDVSADEAASVDEALFRHLGAGGFFGCETPEDSLKSAYVHVTQRCNLQCAGCYSFDEDRNVLEDAPARLINQAISQLASAGVEQIVISGGEPFLRDDLAAIAAFAKIECSIPTVVILSNGVGLDARQLKRVAPFVDRLSISFDGHAASSPAYIRKTQRYAELVRALEAVKGANIPAHMIATIHAKNIDDVRAYVDLADDLGVTLSFSLLSCPGDDPSLAQLIPGDDGLRVLGRSMLALGKDGSPLGMEDSPMGASLTVKRACGAGVKTVSVAADGTVYPCHMLHRRELSMGNLFTDAAHDVLSSEVAQRFRRLESGSFETCSACAFEHLCGGGCRARALFESDDLEASDPYCAMMKEFFSGYGAMIKSAIALRG